MKFDPVMKSCASAFTVQNKSQEDISEQGKELMVDLFGGKSKDTLSSLCHINFTKKWLVQKHLSPLKGSPNFPCNHIP